MEEKHLNRPHHKKTRKKRERIWSINDLRKKREKDPCSVGLNARSPEA